MNKLAKSLLVIVPLAAIVLAISNAGGFRATSGTRERPLSDVMRGSAAIEAVEWQGEELWVTEKGQSEYLVRAVDAKTPLGAEIAKSLVARGASVRLLAPPISSSVANLLVVLSFPILIFALLYYFVLRVSGTGAQQSHRADKQPG